MRRCTSCGLFKFEDYTKFKTQYGDIGDHLRSSIVYTDVISFSPLEMIHSVAFCVVQEEAFLQQAIKEKIEVEAIEPYELCGLEHNCSYYNAKVPGTSLSDYTKQYTEERRALKMRPISLDGSTIINSQIGTSGSTLKAYINNLNIESNATNEVRELKQTLINLRKAIEISQDLEKFQKTASLVDIDTLTNELSKPVDKQDEPTIEHFWTRINNSVSISAGLTTITMALGKILGLIA